MSKARREGKRQRLSTWATVFFFVLGWINLPGAAVCSCGSLAKDHMTHTNLQEKVIGSSWLALPNGELSLRLDPKPPDQN